MAEDVISRIKHEVQRILTEGEMVLAVAPQNAINSPLKRDSAVVTSRRFIIYRPKFLGRMDLEDFLWQDVVEVRITTRLLGATINVTARRREQDGTFRTRSGTVEGLEKQSALRLYAAAQQLEEQWREKNRVRQMEEERARAGGVYLNAPEASRTGDSALPVEERLERLKSLYEKGLISHAEYESRKAQIITEL